MATTTWQHLMDSNPDHSRNYAKRWENLVEEGQDIDGEARLADAMAGRESRILDVGAGTGRTGGYLAAQGHYVTGVDLDPFLVDYARTEYPDAEWHVGDLTGPHADLPQGPFDLLVSAGNVFAFVAPEGRRAALDNLRAWLRPPHAGFRSALDDDAARPDPGDDEAPARLPRAVIGFGLDRGWTYAEFTRDLASAGLVLQQAFSTWDLEAFDAGSSDFLVAVLVAADDVA